MYGYTLYTYVRTYVIWIAVAASASIMVELSYRWQVHMQFCYMLHI